MLEKLLDMASDLAYIALENDRWHHTAASRAIIEQLTPRIQRRSSVACDLHSKKWMTKAASSVEFASLRKSTPVKSTIIADAGLLEESSCVSPPGMAQVSASSESSVEANDAQDDAEEEEECEEWAASVILDVSVEQMMVSTGREARSNSVSSDGSSESEKGFWYVRPSCSPIQSDDGSVNWDAAGGKEDPCCSSMELSCPSSCMPDKALKSSMVTFAEDVIEKEIMHSPFSRRPSLALLTAKRPSLMTSTVSWTAEDTLGSSSPPRLERLESGIARSKSYSALSVASEKGAAIKKEAASQERLTEEHDLYRKYFHNFIELVIARETTAALHNSKHASVAL
jgi:hypothetical protein